MSDQRKAVIKNADMEDKMQQDAVDIASKALSEYNIEKVRRKRCCGCGATCGDILTCPISFDYRMLRHTSRRNSIDDTIQHGELRIAYIDMGVVGGRE